MNIEEYEKIYELMEQLNNTLCQLEESGRDIPCVRTNVKMLKTHSQILAVELGCESK